MATPLRWNGVSLGATPLHGARNTPAQGWSINNFSHSMFTNIKVIAKGSKHYNQS